MRRSFQFQLKSLFLLTFLVDVFLSGMAVQRRETIEMRRLAEYERDRAMAAEEQARAALDDLMVRLAQVESTNKHPPAKAKVNQDGQESND
jgi:hypothetical protein